MNTLETQGRTRPLEAASAVDPLTAPAPLEWLLGGYAAPATVATTGNPLGN